MLWTCVTAMTSRVLIYWLCAAYALIILTLCYTLPFSRIFKLVHSYESLFERVEAASKCRYEASVEYFETTDPHSSSALYFDRLQRGNLTFAVGIITVQRTRGTETQNSLRYLIQSAALLDKALKEHPFFTRTVPFICNVDVFPRKHLDAVDLYRFMPYTERYGENTLGIDPLKIPKTNKLFRDLSIHSTKYAKETFDYTYCLLSAAALRPNYIILIEDDTLPHQDFPVVLEHLMNSRLKLSDISHHKGNFSYLKLYYPSKWQGFAFEVISILDLFSWSALGALMFGVLHFLCTWKFRLKGIQHQRKVFLIGFLTALLTCWLIGRQNIHELRRMSKHLYRLQSSEGCCTQAMLYPLHIVDPLSQYLSSARASQHTDLAILDFSARYALTTWQVEPSLFYHVGLHTTLDMQQKHPEEFILPI